MKTKKVPPTYTVKSLAQISKVSVRTLHFYDEIGLLKPAYVGENGYRYYEETQLLRLQQVLFYRELGFELRSIQRLLDQPNFDSAKALRKHRQALRKEKDRVEQLIRTLDQTLHNLKKGTPMKPKALFQGFDPAKQAEYERQLEKRFGAHHPALVESKAKTGQWSRAEWEKSRREWDALCRDFAAALQAGHAADSPAVQKIVLRHHRWLMQFWTPHRESYTGLGLGYTSPEWAPTFAPNDSQHPRLAQYLAEAMRHYAETQLKD